MILVFLAAAVVGTGLGRFLVGAAILPTDQAAKVGVCVVLAAAMLLTVLWPEQVGYFVGRTFAHG
jgi:hypothetical protein